MEIKIEEIRHKLIDATLFGSVIFIFPLVFVSLLRLTQTGWLWVYPVHICYLVLFILIFLFRSRLSVNLKTHLISSLWLIFSLFGTIQFGIAGGFYFCLLPVTVATMIFGKRYGFIYITISLIIIAFAGILHHNHIIKPGVDLNSYNSNITSWLMIFVVLLYTMIIITQSIGLFYDLFTQNIKTLIQKNEEQVVVQKELLIAKEKAEEKEHKLKDAQSLAKLGNWELDIASNKLYWSDEIYQIFDCLPQELGANYEAFLDAIHPLDRNIVDETYTNSIKNKLPYEIIYRLLLTDGRIKYVNECCETYYSNEGKPIRSFGTIQDITERKQMEKGLQESEARFRSLFENAPVGVFYSTTDGKIIQVNNEYAKMMGYVSPEEAKEIINKSSIAEAIYVRPDERLNLVEKMRTTPGNWIRTEKQFRRKNGTHIIANLIMRALPDNINQFEGFLEDITELKEAQRQILTATIEAEERERLNFSQELHDGIGPLLSAIKMYIQWLSMPNANLDQSEILKDIEKLLDESMSTVREISFKLSPHILLNYGLVEAMQAYIQKIKKSSQIIIVMRLENLKRFNEKAETMVYRVLCECINNTIKHANASEIDIMMNFENDLLVGEYSDNGKGFDVNKVMNGYKGLGLFNMQSRIESINGNLIITSTQNEGTTVKFSVKTDIK